MNFLGFWGTKNRGNLVYANFLKRPKEYAFELFSSFSLCLINHLEEENICTNWGNGMGLLGVGFSLVFIEALKKVGTMRYRSKL